MQITPVTTAISAAFSNLASVPKLYDYWISELYTLNGDIIEEKWNEKTLEKMEDDVMHNV